MWRASCVRCRAGRPPHVSALRLSAVFLQHVRSTLPFCSHEAHVPTQPPPPSRNTRISRAHGNQEWTKSPCCPTRQRTLQTHRQRRTPLVTNRQLVPLRGHTAIEELFRMGNRWRDPSGRLQVIALPRIESRLLGYVVIVSRAICPKAVGRNRIRRLLRESLRTIANNQPELVEPYGAIALRWLSAAPVRECKRLRLGDVLPAVRAALQKPLSPQ